MKNYCKLFLLIFLVQICAPANAAMDNTIDCAGVPYWDRFVVNDKDIKWSANAGCYGMDSGESLAKQKPAGKGNAAGLYGYSNGANPENKNSGGGSDWKSLYGYQHGQNPDNKHADNLYGYYHGANPSAQLKTKPAATGAPAAVGTPTAEKVIAKPKPSKPVSQKVVAKSKPTPVVAKPAPEKIACAAPAPAREASAIAASAKKLGIDDFCTEINPPVKGKLPDGLVLMRGAPQRMSCVQ